MRSKKNTANETTAMEDFAMTEEVAGDIMPMGAAMGVTLAEQKMEDLAAWFFDNCQVDYGGMAEVKQAIYDNIESHSGLDVLGVAEGLDSGKTWAHKPLTFNGVSAVRPSPFRRTADGDPLPGFYAVLDCIEISSGEVVQISVGSPTILTQIKVLIRDECFPFDGKICPIRRAGTEGRNPPLYIRPLSY